LLHGRSKFNVDALSASCADTVLVQGNPVGLGRFCVI
jgi:hypothetical protein